MKIALNLYFHTFLWCLKRFYEKFFEAPQKSVKTKTQVDFFSSSGREVQKDIVDKFTA